MIIFNGIKNGKITFLSFSNENGQSIDIPVELSIADRITKYLSLIAISPPIKNEQQDEEDDINK